MGFVNGMVIARLKVPPFIATLGMLNVAKGLALVISGLKPIYFNDTPGFNDDRHGLGARRVIPGFDIPNVVLVLFGAAIIASLDPDTRRCSGATLSRWAATRRRRACRASTSTAGRSPSTRSAALFSGLAGVMIAARLNSAQPALGQGYELDAIAAAVIGGTSLSGGEGSILGTIIGAFIISTLTNGLRILSVPQEWQTVVTGAIVILAVYLDILRRREARRSGLCIVEPWRSAYELCESGQPGRAVQL